MIVGVGDAVGVVELGRHPLRLLDPGHRLFQIAALPAEEARCHPGHDGGAGAETKPVAAMTERVVELDRLLEMGEAGLEAATERGGGPDHVMAFDPDRLVVLPLAQLEQLDSHLPTLLEVGDADVEGGQGAEDGEALEGGPGGLRQLEDLFERLLHFGGIAPDRHQGPGEASAQGQLLLGQLR